jgi:phage-related protein
MKLISYICTMEINELREEDLRELIFTQEFSDFYKLLDEKVQHKFDYTMQVVRTIKILPINFVKHLNGTDLYEMRVSVGTNAYRTILFAIDDDNINSAKRVILLNAFMKKSTKDYKKELKIANKILEGLEYDKD